MLSGLNTRRQETPHFSGPDPDYSPRSTPSDRTQPSVLGIRKTPPSRADLDTTTVLKFARTEASGTRNRLDDRRPGYVTERVQTAAFPRGAAGVSTRG